jgi:hypothetical protein
MQNDPILIKITTATQSIVEKAGFRFGEIGTHTSRTIMVKELSELFKHCPQDAARSDYEHAVIEENILGKRTGSTRKLTLQRLSELYGLRQEILLFRILRLWWQADETGHPLLALLESLARDPMLRVTALPILAMKNGEELSRHLFTEALSRGTGERLNESSLDKVVRNTASSWTQSGHLEGRGRKMRKLVRPTPAATAYALLLGYIMGDRGFSLFQTFWAKILDAPQDDLIYLAMDAKRLGFLDMSQAGGVIDISFFRVLTEDERRLIHGTH